MSSPKLVLAFLSPDQGNSMTIYTGIHVINLRMILDSSASLPSHRELIIKSWGSHFQSIPLVHPFSPYPQPLPWSKWQIPWTATYHTLLSTYQQKDFFNANLIIYFLKSSNVLKILQGFPNILTIMSEILNLIPNVLNHQGPMNPCLLTSSSLPFTV